MEKIKLIWDFRNADPLKMAEHHAKHLKEYLIEKKVLNSSAHFKQITNQHAQAFIITEKSNMILLRDALKPQRGELYQEGI